MGPGDHDANGTYHFSATGCYCGSRECPYGPCLQELTDVLVQVIPVLWDAHISPTFSGSYEIGQDVIGMQSPYSVVWQYLSEDNSVNSTVASYSVWCPIINGYMGAKVVCTCTWEGKIVLRVDNDPFSKPNSSDADVFFTPVSISELCTEIRHLAPYTDYECNFFCASDIGEDSLGGTSSFRTKQDRPEKPAPPHVFEAGNDSWTFSWNAPQFPTGVITSYKLRDNQGELVCEGLDLEVTVPKKPFSSSAFTLIIATEVGEGPESDACSDLVTAGSSSSRSSSNDGSKYSELVNRVLSIVMGSILGVVVIVALVMRKKRWVWISGKPPSAQFRKDKWFITDPLTSLVVDNNKVLGRGAFGFVRLGMMRGTNICVAIKSCTREEHTQDFLAEAECLKKLSCPGHENIVRLVGVYNLVSAI